MASYFIKTNRYYKFESWIGKGKILWSNLDIKSVVNLQEVLNKP
ncbi:hypothetical protein wTkk_000472 [Wolbachia endosymbiont of Trichogramma kaykai]